MFFSHKDNIIIIRPRPYQKVGATFAISGRVPLKLLKCGEYFDYRLSLELLDVTGKTIFGSSININPPKNESNLNKLIDFYHPFNFDQIMAGWAIKSQGLMAINISTMGSYATAEKKEIFLPIIIDQLKPPDGYNKELLEKHQTIKERVVRYRKESAEYAEELGRIYKRKEEIFNKSRDEKTEPYQEIDEKFADELFFSIIWAGEDEEKRLLDEKYREALEWSGPLIRGMVGRLNGFEFRVYSNDHGKHFHVIHKEKEINARFSFPEINLVDYIGFKNTIDKKTQERIKNYFSDPANFKKLEAEFIKKQ